MAFTEMNRRSYLLGLKIVSDFGASIAVPVVAFVILGRWLQERYHFAPFGIIVGFIIAAYISTKIIKRKVVWYAAEYKALETPRKKK